MKAGMNDETKIVVAWVGTTFGAITLSNSVLWATLLFTALNIIKLGHELATKRWWHK